MDESLDDYISKANFKVSIGNPNFKGNKQFAGNRRNLAFQRGGSCTQNTSVKDVSITVPAVKKTPGNINKTNQIRDARDKIQTKGKPQDARQKIQERTQNTDARQKLTMIRSQKGPQDVRVKLEAKKQQSNQAVPGQAGFMLTRTVSNSNNIQMSSQGAPGNIKITKTLTKIMPPGYEGLVEGPASQPLKVHTEQRGINVKQRLGPKEEPRRTSAVNVTRTIQGNSQFLGHDSQRPQVIEQRPPVPIIQQSFPPPQQTAVLSRPPPFSVQYAPTPLPYSGASLSKQDVPPPAHIHYILNPDPQTGLPPQHVPQPHPLHFAPPPHQAPPPPPGVIVSVQHQQPARSEGPPYPVDDNVFIKRTVAHEIQRPNIPVIQVENDQYRVSQQQHTHYVPTPQVYQPSGQPHGYMPTLSHPEAPQSPPPQSDPLQQPHYTPTSIRRTVSNVEPSVPKAGPSKLGPLVKTVVNENVQYTASDSKVSPLKRKAEGGRLHLSGTNTVPVLRSTDFEEDAPRSGVSRYSKPVPQVSDEPVVKKTRTEVDDDKDVISPLQGYKVVIANLHVTVTQDDIIELFGAIGAVRKVKMVKQGTAEVTYVKKDDALEATRTYNERELDGQPMIVKLVTSPTARIKEVSEKVPPSVKPVATGPLNAKTDKKTRGPNLHSAPCSLLSKKPALVTKATEKKGVEVDVLHKALFKTGSSGSTKPVTFTVNI